MAARHHPNKKTPSSYVEIEHLTADELQLLIECPYTSPGALLRGERDVAERLIKRGLLERDPGTGNVRCTSTGEAQAAPLSHTRVKWERDCIEEMWKANRHDDSARDRERRLWQRILVECALSGSRTASIALETCEIFGAE